MPSLTLETNPRDLRVHRVVRTDVPYVPTDEAVVQVMLRMADLRPGMKLYDLGCGDGRIAIAAARLGATAVGVDIDPQRIRECYWNARKAGVSERVRFVQGNLFDMGFADADAMTLYLLTGINLKLRPKILWQLRPGARVVSNFFDMGDWTPDETVHAYKRTLYRWTVPAWLEGAWRCIVREGTRTWHMDLRLHRRFQQLWGDAHVGRGRMTIDSGRIDGTHIRFRLDRRTAPALWFQGTYDGHYLRGQVKADGMTGLWCAQR